jgi:hypothetical protein
MKNFIHGIEIIFTAIIILSVVNGCQKNSDFSIQKASNAFNKTSTITQPDAIQAPVLQEGTMTSAISVDDGMLMTDVNISLDPGTTDFLCVAPGDADFVKFLNSLNLTGSQKEQLNKALTGLKICRTEFYTYLKKSNLEIIAKANKEREELMAKFKKKLITEKQLKVSLAELNKKTKIAIEINSSKKVIMAGLEKCFNNYLSTLKTILTTEQWRKLETWYNEHK